MAAESGLITALYLHAKESRANLEELKCAKKQALQSIVDGNGGQVISGSGNGLSFSINNSKLTNAEWFEALQIAIQRCSSQKRSGISRARIC